MGLVGRDATTIRNLNAFKLQRQLIFMSLELLCKQKAKPEVVVLDRSFFFCCKRRCALGNLGRVVIRNVASKVAAGGARGTQVTINKARGCAIDV